MQRNEPLILMLELILELLIDRRDRRVDARQTSVT